MNTAASSNEKILAALEHGSVIMAFLGPIIPVIIWSTQRKKSARLRFQSMQAFIYQIIALVVYMLGMAVYMVFFFGMFLLLILGGTSGADNAIRGPGAILLTVFLGLMFLFWMIFTIGMPFYTLLAGWAGFRVLCGHHFRYPILGKMIEKRIETSHSLEPVT